MQCKKCLRKEFIKKKVELITKKADEVGEHPHGFCTLVAEHVHVGLDYKGFTQLYADICKYCGEVQRIYFDP